MQNFSQDELENAYNHIFQNEIINTDEIAFANPKIFDQLSPSDRALKFLEFEDLRISSFGEVEFVLPNQYTSNIAKTNEGKILPTEKEVAWLLKFLIPLAKRHNEFFVTHDNVEYRGAQSQGRDALWFHFRRIEEDTRPLGAFPTTDILYPYLMECGVREGLILVGGKTGSGKTSLLASYTQAITSEYGGLTITIEDPIEKKLEGKYTSSDPANFGRIIQTNMPEELFHIGIKDCMRRRPQCILLGELRTTEAVHAALNASTSGHLVLATMHGGSTGEILLNLISRAAPAGNTGHYWKMLAETLQMVVFMSREAGKPKPNCEILPICAQANEAGFRSKIREGNIESLSEDYEQMMSRIARDSQNSRQSISLGQKPRAGGFIKR